MSATFSDYSAVKCFLRNDDSLPCIIPPQGNSNHEIKILVKEYIQSKDKEYETELKKLDTEHNALQTEYDSIKGVIEKNVERGFKAFS